MYHSIHITNVTLKAKDNTKLEDAIPEVVVFEKEHPDSTVVFRYNFHTKTASRERVREIEIPVNSGSTYEDLHAACKAIEREFQEVDERSDKERTKEWRQEMARRDSRFLRT